MPDPSLLGLPGEARTCPNKLEVNVVSNYVIYSVSPIIYSRRACLLRYTRPLSQPRHIRKPLHTMPELVQAHRPLTSSRRYNPKVCRSAMDRNKHLIPQELICGLSIPSPFWGSCSGGNYLTVRCLPPSSAFLNLVCLVLTSKLVLGCNL